MKKMFITRPRYNKAMNYLFEWSKEVIEAAEDKGWLVHKADGQNANNREVHSRLEKTNPHFVFFNGHGNESEICGHNCEVIMDESSSHLLKNSITFARSCKCLSSLGETAVENGCKAFLGYRDYFWFPMVAKYESIPLQDVAAKPVFEVSNLVAIEILKNKGVSEAIDAARARANKYILKLVLSNEFYDRAALRALIQNDDCLDFKGSSDARIE